LFRLKDHLKINTTSHNRALRDCGSTVNTTIYPKGYAQSKCVYSNDALVTAIGLASIVKETV